MRTKKRLKKLERRIEILECSHYWKEIKCYDCAYRRLGREFQQRLCALRLNKKTNKSPIRFHFCKKCGVMAITINNKGKRLDTF